MNPPPRRYRMVDGVLTPNPGYLPPLEALVVAEQEGRSVAGLDNPEDYAACEAAAEEWLRKNPL